MKQLSYKIPAAKLRRLTHLTAKVSNETRWSSIFSMLDHYINFLEHIRKVDDADIKDHLLTEDEDEKSKRFSRSFVCLNL